MKSLLAAFEKLGETKPGDVEADMKTFEQLTTKEDGTANEKCGTVPRSSPCFLPAILLFHVRLALGEDLS